MTIRDTFGLDHAPVEGRRYGIEVEMEHWDSTRPPVPWTWTEDGSLREAGVEFLTPPLELAALRSAITALYVQARHLGWRGTVRTGIHVHANVQDVELENLSGIIGAYALLEPVMFRMCGADREENIYCVPWYRAPSELETVAAVLEGRTPHVTSLCKYSALYLEPLRRFGTIEFRHAPTWAGPGQLLLWVHAIDKLVRYGMTRTAADVLAAYDSDGPDEFMRSVFGAYAPRILSFCEKSVEDIIEEVDAPATAEALLPCMYKPGWAPVLPPVEGDGTTGYHRLRNRANGWHDDEPHFIDEGDEDEYREEIY